jgi:hypothetical protein
LIETDVPAIVGAAVDLEVAEEEALVEVDLVLIEVQEKCTKQFVLSVERNVKSLSNRQRENPSFVKSVLLKKDQEGINNF